jgi:hypothetical protein
MLGCSAVERWSPVRGGVLALAANDSHVYWTSGADHSALLRASHRDDEPVVFYDRMTWARDLCLHGDAAYVATSTGVVRAPLMGVGASKVVDDVDVHRVVVDAAGMCWLSRERQTLVHIDTSGRRFDVREPHPRAIALDAEHIYLTASRGLLSISRGGGEVTLLAARRDLNEVVVAGGQLFVTASDGVLHGPTLETYAAAVRPAGLVARGSDVYWSDHRIMRNRESLSAGVAAQALAVGGGHLYWGDANVPALQRLKA